MARAKVAVWFLLTKCLPEGGLYREQYPTDGGVDS
jgi:hypothetical protein